MKHVFYCYFIFLIGQTTLAAQNRVIPPQHFDPALHPVAIKTDSSIRLMISEYLLSKSFETIQGKPCILKKMPALIPVNGAPYLLLEGEFQDDQRQRISIGILLLPDPTGRYYYASSQAIFCERLGCNDCSISNGKCVGCCEQSGNNGYSTQKTIYHPLRRVVLNFD